MCTLLKIIYAINFSSINNCSLSHTHTHTHSYTHNTYTLSLSLTHTHTHFLAFSAYINVPMKSEAISQWLKDSGLKINEKKTELCLFYRNDHVPISLTINGTIIKSKPSINVLGVQFDSKLSWYDQVNKSINKAKKTLHGINIIRKSIPIIQPCVTYQ